MSYNQHFGNGAGGRGYAPQQQHFVNMQHGRQYDNSINMAAAGSNRPSMMPTQYQVNAAHAGSYVSHGNHSPMVPMQHQVNPHAGGYVAHGSGQGHGMGQLFMQGQALGGGHANHQQLSVNDGGQAFGGVYANHQQLPVNHGGQAFGGGYANHQQPSFNHFGNPQQFIMPVPQGAVPMAKQYVHIGMADSVIRSQHAQAPYDNYPSSVGTQARYAMEADAECFTPEDAEALHQQRRYARVQGNQAHSRDVELECGYFFCQGARYKILRTIQRGGDPQRMSDGIYEIEHPSGEVRILKRLSVVNSAQIARVRAEKEALAKLAEHHSPHINHLYDSFWVNGYSKCSLVLEKCDGTIETLIAYQNSHRRKFCEKYVWHVIQHIVCGLSLMHHGIRDPLNKGQLPTRWDTIVHLDIKPGNIFYLNKRSKGKEDDEFMTLMIGDFGCVVTKEDMDHGRISRYGQPFGTDGWFPPEHAASKGKCEYGRPTDIWQLGALISVMCNLTSAPDEAILASQDPCGQHYSKDLNALVRLMVAKDPMARPSAIDIAEMMKAKGKYRK